MNRQVTTLNRNGINIDISVYKSIGWYYYLHENLQDRG